MNVTQLIKRVRRSAFVEDASVDWTDINILEELNDTQAALFERAVVRANSGYWLQHAYYAVVAGQAKYRLPSRAAAGTVGNIQLSATGSIDWFDLPEVDEATAERYEYMAIDIPQRCIVRGELLQLLPAPSTGGYVIRVQYAQRPSRMVMPQALSTAGVVFSVNTVSRTLTLNSNFQTVAEDGALTNISGTATIDVIKPTGWHSVVWSGAASGVSGINPVLSVDASGVAEASDMSVIAAGDVCRFADQSDYPALPTEFHRVLADATAAKILTVRGMHDRADELMAHVSPELKRFEALLSPRVHSAAHALVAPEFC